MSKRIDNMRRFLEEAKRIMKFSGGPEDLEEKVEKMEGIVDHLEHLEDKLVERTGKDLDHLEEIPGMEKESTAAKLNDFLMGDPEIMSDPEKFISRLKKVLPDLHLTPEDITRDPNILVDLLKKAFPGAEISPVGKFNDKGGAIAITLPAPAETDMSRWSMGGSGTTAARVPQKDDRAERLAKLFEKVKTQAVAVEAPPEKVVKCIQDWLKDKWKTPIFWGSQDPIEQTWNLQTLVRGFFKAAGDVPGLEFAQGSRQWGSEVVGEHKKLSMGLPSVIWAIHETIHLVGQIEDEHKAWVATVRLITDAFKDIDPKYAEEMLQAEFDNPPDPIPKPQSAGGWRGREGRETEEEDD